MALRDIISKMSSSQAYQVCRQFTVLGKALQQIKERVIFSEDLPLFGITRGEHELQELIYYNFLKCFHNEKFGDDYSTLVNYDWYHPQ